MPPIKLYKAGFCPYCIAAARFLREVKGVEVEEIDLTGDDEGRMDLYRRTGRRTVEEEAQDGPALLLAGAEEGTRGAAAAGRRSAPPELRDRERTQAVAPREDEQLRRRAVTGTSWRLVRREQRP